MDRKRTAGARRGRRARRRRSHAAWTARVSVGGLAISCTLSLAGVMMDAAPSFTATATPAPREVVMAVDALPVRPRPATTAALGTTVTKPGAAPPPSTSSTTTLTTAAPISNGSDPTTVPGPVAPGPTTGTAPPAAAPPSTSPGPAPTKGPATTAPPVTTAPPTTVAPPPTTVPPNTTPTTISHAS